MKRKQKRGSARQSECEFLGLWIPKQLAALLDRAVVLKDSDRSKLVRESIREKLEVAR